MKPQAFRQRKYRCTFISPRGKFIKTRYMKRIYPFVCALFVSIAAISQPVNAGMENWIKVVLFEHPVMGINTSSSNYETFFEDGTTNVFPIERQAEGQALRMVNVAQDGEVIPGYFLTGNVPEDSQGSFVFDGGLDFETSDVSGIRLDLRYEFPVNKPGIVVLQFKKEGQPIGTGNFDTGTSVFYLEGQQSQWINREFLLEEPLGATPDQVVIAFASADALNDDQPFDEGAFLEIDNLEWIDAADEIPGGHFDSWAQVPPIFVPAGCVVDIHPDHRNYFQADDAKEGLLALGIFTNDIPSTPDVGWVKFGAEDVDGSIVPSIELQPDQDLLSFWYKYEAANDVAEAIVHFYQSADLASGPVFTKAFDLPPTQEYTLVEYAFAEDLIAADVQADLMYIDFRSSKESGETTPQVGSNLLIDDLDISGISPVLAPVTGRTVGTTFVRCHPNPTMGRAIFDFDTPGSGMYRIFSATGAMLSVHSYAHTKRVIHDLSNLPNGLYTFRIYHGSQHATVRVMKI